MSGFVDRRKLHPDYKPVPNELPTSAYIYSHVESDDPCPVEVETHEGKTTVTIEGAHVGTCGNDIDPVEVWISRCASIPPIAVGYDLEAGKWVIYERDENMDLREVARHEIRDLE